MNQNAVEVIESFKDVIVNHIATKTGPKIPNYLTFHYLCKSRYFATFS